MKLIKTSLIAATLAIGTTAGVANADLVSGVFDIDIYQYDAGASASAAAATAANVAAAGSAYASVVYTGDINFKTPPGDTIKDFLLFGGGSVDDDSLLSVAFSDPNFGLTTLFDITPQAGSEFSVAVTGTINHDDGISLFDGSGTLVTPAAAADPTTAIPTAFALPAGSFRLIYSAANSNPEVLNMNATVVPLPAAAWLFGSALVGMGFIGRRKTKA